LEAIINLSDFAETILLRDKSLFNSQTGRHSHIDIEDIKYLTEMEKKKHLSGQKLAAILDMAIKLMSDHPKWIP
jgi:hypothetical protein